MLFRSGGGVRMGIPVTEYDRVNLSLAAEHLTVNTYKGAPKRYADFINQYGKGTDGVGSFKGWLYKGTIGWGRNKTDSALWPTRGYMTGINGEIALPGSDLQYYTLTHNQTWFFPLTKDFTLMLGGEVGIKSAPIHTKVGIGIGSPVAYECILLR